MSPAPKTVKCCTCPLGAEDERCRWTVDNRFAAAEAAATAVGAAEVEARLEEDMMLLVSCLVGSMLGRRDGVEERLVLVGRIKVFMTLGCGCISG